MTLFEFFRDRLLTVFFPSDLYEYVLPLPFSENTISLGTLITAIFVVVMSVCVVHFLIVVPYRVILRLLHYKGGARHG